MTKVFLVENALNAIRSLFFDKQLMCSSNTNLSSKKTPNILTFVTLMSLSLQITIFKSLILLSFKLMVK